MLFTIQPLRSSTDSKTGGGRKLTCEKVDVLPSVSLSAVDPLPIEEQIDVIQQNVWLSQNSAVSQDKEYSKTLISECPESYQLLVFSGSKSLSSEKKQI